MAKSSQCLPFKQNLVCMRMRCELPLKDVPQHTEGSYHGFLRFWLDRWQACWCLNDAPSSLGTGMAVTTLLEGMAPDTEFWQRDSGKGTVLMLESSICWGVSLSGKWNDNAPISIWHNDKGFWIENTNIYWIFQYYYAMSARRLGLVISRP